MLDTVDELSSRASNAMGIVSMRDLFFRHLAIALAVGPRGLAPSNLLR
jgi:hypothetical protein